MPAEDRTTFGGIYAIRHVDSGKMYIGSAVNFSNRWGKHRGELCRQIHHNRHLQNAWNKYGPDAFVFEVLEFVSDNEDLVRVEQEHLDHFQSWREDVGYNLAPTAGSPLGVKRSDETKAKMSVLGKSRSPEAIAKFSASGKSPEALAKKSESLKGRTFSDERRAKLKAAWKPRTYTPEYREKLGAACRGRKLTDDHRAKISAGNKGKTISEDQRSRTSATLKGRKIGPMSPEHKAKIGAANKGNKSRLGKKHTPETRAKMSAAWERRRSKAAAIADHESLTPAETRP